MRILIIEDDSNISEFLKTSLEQAGFFVDVCDNGDRGSYIARTNDYDLIVLDYALPGKTGDVVCRDIRTTGKTVPILMLSIETDPHTKARFLNCGADDFLSKPYSFEELLARVRALLRRPNPVMHEVFTLGDYKIDIQGQTVRKGNDFIQLTKKEFGLLEYLVRHRGTVLSRGAIMEHVWDMAGDLFSNTIETHVLNLRKKLGDKDHTMIITVPGRGYKISGSWPI